MARSGEDVYNRRRGHLPGRQHEAAARGVPHRFVNVGVAEQTMIGVCAGLALRGCTAFAYSIATFSL